jgi:salicylate hydroxylase
MKERLGLFEQIRRDRGSAIQVLSNSGPPMPQSVRDAALKYLPKGTSLQNQDDVINVIFSYDVIGKTKAILAASVAGQDHKLNGVSNGVPNGMQNGIQNGAIEL